MLIYIHITHFKIFFFQKTSKYFDFVPAKINAAIRPVRASSPCSQCSFSFDRSRNNPRKAQKTLMNDVKLYIIAT